MTVPTYPDHLDVDQLGDYLDGLLPAAVARAAAEHLGACDACGARLAELRALLAGAAASPPSIEPARDLWPAVRARIDVAAPRAARRLWPVAPTLAAAAAAVLVVGAGAATLRLGRSAPPAVAAARPSYARLDAEYAQAAAQLAAAVRGHGARGALAPTTVATVEQSLRTLDGALDEARVALARDPHNAALVAMLSATHERKLALLKQAAALPTEL